MILFDKCQDKSVVAFRPDRLQGRRFKTRFGGQHIGKAADALDPVVFTCLPDGKGQDYFFGVNT